MPNSHAHTGDVYNPAVSMCQGCRNNRPEARRPRPQEFGGCDAQKANTQSLRESRTSLETDCAKHHSLPVGGVSSPTALPPARAPLSVSLTRLSPHSPVSAVHTQERDRGTSAQRGMSARSLIMAVVVVGGLLAFQVNNH